MLTRLRVSGFKNLVDVDIRFGPFTCIAGANGVGKSNLFDAIGFLGALADKPLVEAALEVRDEGGGRTGDLRNLFHRVGDNYTGNTMKFQAEMIVPLTGADDLGQPAVATITFLEYTIELELKGEPGRPGLSRLVIREEKLSHIRLSDAYQHLLFPHSVKWRKSAVKGRLTGHRSAPFISTEGDEGNRVVKVHLDGGKSGQPRPYLAANLPRTALSAVNAAEGATASLVRKEMRSWRMLQLEPSALRRPDSFSAPVKLTPEGLHLPSALYHLAHTQTAELREQSEPSVYGRVVSRLRRLLDDVHAVTVDRDEKRELQTLTVTGDNGTIHPARSLSDGTLRFLALVVLEMDSDSGGLLCLEEPENGIHPGRIPAMLKLLKDLAVDPQTGIGTDNPLRQVIVNTHSPSVVGQVEESDLVLAELRDSSNSNHRRYRYLDFAALPDTWRTTECAVRAVKKGTLIEYLQPYRRDPDLYPPEDRRIKAPAHRRRGKRVIDREDLQAYLPFDQNVA